MSGASEERLHADAEARRLAHTEFERPLVVEAGAGTGKTALLTARVVAWCLGPGWQLRDHEGADNAAVALTAAEAFFGRELDDEVVTEAFAEIASVVCPGLQLGAIEDEAFLLPFKFFRNRPATLHLSAVGSPAGDGEVLVSTTLRSRIQPMSRSRASRHSGRIAST